MSILGDPGHGPGGGVVWPEAVRRFPGQHGHLLLPAHRRAAALSGLRSYSPCVPKAMLAQRAGLLAVRVGLARGVGPVGAVGRGLPQNVWDAVRDDLSTAFPRLATVVPVLRRQPGRRGVAMLLLDASDRRIGFVKIGPGEVAREIAVLEALQGRRLRVAVVPGLLRVGASADWNWFVTEPLPDRVTRMGDPPLAELADDVATALAGVPRPPGVPEHWEPMHADFTPWNVRCLRGRYYVFDWQDHGYGPPAADAVLYEAARAVVDRAWPGRRRRRSVVPPGLVAQACAFWLATIAQRSGGTATDHALTTALTAELNSGMTSALTSGHDRNGTTASSATSRVATDEC